MDGVRQESEFEFANRQQDILNALTEAIQKTDEGRELQYLAYCCSLPNKRWVQVVWENGEYSQIDVGMKHDMALIRAVAESIGW